MGTEGRACSQLWGGPGAGSRPGRCSHAAGVGQSLRLPPHVKSVQGVGHISPTLGCRPEPLAALPAKGWS